MGFQKSAEKGPRVWGGFLPGKLGGEVSVFTSSEPLSNTTGTHIEYGKELWRRPFYGGRKLCTLTHTRGRTRAGLPFLGG